MKARVLTAALVAVVGSAAGWSGTTQPLWRVPAAYCVDCQQVNDNCGQNDSTKTSAMDVQYVEQAPSEPDRYIEPDGATSWTIAAYWRTAPPAPCPEYWEAAYVDVTWTGSQWQVSNTTLSNNIVGISVCDGYECDGTSGTHSWNYQLIVDVRDPPTGYPTYNLKKVVYSTTSVPDGDEIEFTGHEYVECDSLGSSVDPTSQGFIGSDEPNDKWGSGRCAWSCSVVGGSMTIYYQ